MAAESLELISDGHGLLEGPVFEPGLGLLVADATKGGVLLLAPGKPPREVVAHRRGIGGMAMHADGGLVISGRNVAHKALEATESATRVLLPNDSAMGTLGFNDLVTDAAGRIYVGSLAFAALALEPDETANDKPAGQLHMIDLDGSVREVGRGVILTNGLGFSPDGTRLYQADTLRRELRVFDVAADGALRNDRRFARVRDAMPDGLAVAEDGSIWVALFFGAGVAVFSPEGVELRRIAVDVPVVTSVCFGGDDWRDLYVVTGPCTMPGGPAAAGRVYRMRAPVPGRRRPLARVAISNH